MFDYLWKLVIELGLPLRLVAKLLATQFKVIVMD